MGLRVRLLLRCSPKSVLKNRNSEFEGCLEDYEAPSSPLRACFRNGWGRGRVKARTCTHNHIGQATCALSVINPVHLDQSTCKPLTKGHKMPEGTRGFTTGRGKPIRS